MASELDKAKRALVSLLKVLALAYKCLLQLTRESSDKDVASAYRTVSRKTHPDKGGKAADQKRLNGAHDNWRREVQKAPGKGGKRTAKNNGDSGGVVVAPLVPRGSPSGTRAEYRINSEGVLLTYQGFGDLVQWSRFLRFVGGRVRKWRVKHWGATLESNAGEGNHAHLMLQFTSCRDCTVKTFCFEGLRPNAQTNDLLGEGFCRKRLQTSLGRCFFYVWANKVGTVRQPSGELCVAGTYEPAWTQAKCRYEVKGAWPEKLWKAYKLDSDQYYEYLHLCRDGVPYRKRNFEAYEAWAESRALEKEVVDRTKRIRSNPRLYKPFAKVPEAEQWLELCQHDALRYPVLLVHAPSRGFKTEWAQSLFKNPLVLKVGTLTQFPEGVRRLDRKRHDGLVLDDVRDLEFLSDHQEKLQGKYSWVVEFATTPSGQYAFQKDFFRLPVVVTVNNSTKNLSFLSSHDFVANRDNVRVLSFKGRPGEAPPSDSLGA